MAAWGEGQKDSLFFHQILPNILERTAYLWQVHDEIVSIGLFGCFDYIFHGSLIPTIANVLCNCGGKQHWLLFNNTDL